MRSGRNRAGKRRGREREGERNWLGFPGDFIWPNKIRQGNREYGDCVLLFPEGISSLHSARITKREEIEFSERIWDEFIYNLMGLVIK